MNNNFIKAMQFIALHEWSNRPDGAYTNDPVDPGGETRFGIAKRSHPTVDIKNLTLGEALSIYESDYWNHYNLDQVDSPMCFCLMDSYVQHRPSVVRQLIDIAKGDWKLFIASRREFYLRLITKNPSQIRFKNGWMNRMTDLSKFCEIQASPH